MTTISKPLVPEVPVLAAPSRRLAGKAFRRLGAFVARIVAMAVHRWEVRGMLELDDRALRDIGLVRNDVLGALAEPLSRDPSAVLMTRSMERAGRLRLLARAVERMTPKP